MKAFASLVAVATMLFPALASAQTDPFPLPPRSWDRPVSDMQPFTYVLVDRLEYQLRNGANGWVWDGEAWFGGDFDKLWLKSEGESTAGRGVEAADVQALYARRISPYWYFQTGVRTEVRPSPARTTGVLAVEGLAPYLFNVQASAFVGRGVSGRVEVEYDQLITQRLILQPRFETNFSSSRDRERGIGSGVNDIELGVRLRYEIRREFAPYIGVSWTRKVGNTADLARREGESVGVTAIEVGLRAWY